MKSKKKILIISPFFFPEPISTGKFNTDVVIDLAEKGHEITVLCFHPFYPSWKIESSSQQLDNVTIVRGGKYLKFPKSSILRRIVLELGFAFFILRKLIKHQKNKDILIPIFPPSLAFYSLLPFLNKRIKKVGIVHDLQEIYSSNKKGFINKFVKYFIHKVENKCYNSCSKLIFLSNEMKNEAKKLYQLKSTELKVQYPFITISDKITNDLNDILEPKRVNIVYSGALGEKQNPEGLFDFFNYASGKIENAIFHIFSQGESFNQLKQQNINQNIQFHHLVNKENLEELYHKSDVQFLPQLPNTSKGSLPSKLPNLLASGCKILAITDKNSEIEKLFENENLLKVTNSWDNEVVLKDLKGLIDSSFDKLHQIKVAKKIFTIDKMVSEILN